MRVYLTDACDAPAFVVAPGKCLYSQSLDEILIHFQGQVGRYKDYWRFAQENLEDYREIRWLLTLGVEVTKRKPSES